MVRVVVACCVFVLVVVGCTFCVVAGLAVVVVVVERPASVVRELVAGCDVD